MPLAIKQKASATSTKVLLKHQW